MVQRFGQDFVIVADVLQRAAAGGTGLWNSDDRFYFDVVRHGAERFPLKVYSIVGLVPLIAASVMEPAALAQLPAIERAVASVFSSRPFQCPMAAPKARINHVRFRTRHTRSGK